MEIKFEKTALNFVIFFFKFSSLGCLLYLLYMNFFDGSGNDIVVLQSMIISFLMFKEFSRYRERLGA